MSLSRLRHAFALRQPPSVGGASMLKVTTMRGSHAAAATGSAERTGGAQAAVIQQYSLARILAVWAAAALPMGALAWFVAPRLADRLGGAEPLVQALLICLTA